MSKISPHFDNPVDVDFYCLMRRIEAAHRHLPRLGEARRPSAEPVRLGQEAALDFPTGAVSRIARDGKGRLRIAVRFLGLFGSQGPLPLHLTELARERERSHGDPTLARFADVFHHRLLSFFYRAWRQAQPAASFDHPDRDRFKSYVGALFGHGTPTADRRDAEMSEAKRFLSGRLAPAQRSAEGLAAIVAEDFGLPARVECFRARWMALPRSERTRLGVRGASSALGAGAVIGSRTPDVQHQADIVLGPLDLTAYRAFLPGSAWLTRLRKWVLEYFGDCLSVSLVPLLDAAEVPQAVLGRSGRLGWDAWLGARASIEPAADLSLPLASMPSPE
jgi:type VI secretion system protein ImpH